MCEFCSIWLNHRHNHLLTLLTTPHVELAQTQLIEWISSLVVTQLQKSNLGLSISLFLLIDDNHTKIGIKLKIQASTSHKCKFLTWLGPYVAYPAWTTWEGLDKFHKIQLGSVSPPTYVLAWFGFKLSHMLDWSHGRITTTKCKGFLLLDGHCDAEVYRIKPL